MAAVLDHTGRLCGTQAFPAWTRGNVALVTWAERFGPVERIGVEGTGTYGQLLLDLGPFGPVLLNDVGSGYGPGHIRVKPHRCYR
jgi:hypothetical protein